MKKIQPDGRVDKFYKRLFTCKTEHEGMLMAAVLMEVFFMVIALVPFQELVNDADTAGICGMMGGMFGCLAPGAYLKSYVYFKDGNKESSITDKLKYLPVDVREFRKARLVYLVKFVSICFGIAFFLQMLTSVFTYYSIIWQNVCYIVVLAFIWPIVSNLPSALK